MATLSKKTKDVLGDILSSALGRVDHCRARLGNRPLLRRELEQAQLELKTVLYSIVPPVPVVDDKTGNLKDSTPR